MALLLQRIGDFARHVGLVVTGQHGVGLEHARRIEHALDHALTLAEQIGQNASIRDRQDAARIATSKATDWPSRLINLP